MNTRTPFTLALVFTLVSAALLALPRTICAADLTQKAMATYAPTPAVPKQALIKHLRGDGLFRCYVRPDGTVSRVTVERSTGSYILDTTAIAALAQWRFRPGSKSEITIPFHYKL